jgi:glycosyltransferase involved in cell wall biosynthesis
VCYIGWKKEALYRFGISANKIFEYMYSGKPVLHAVSAFNDPVADARCGISVEAENVKEIVNAVKKLSVMSSEQLNSLGKNGREFVIKNHSYQALAAKVVELI